jgi:hypothetical protein
MDVATSSLGDRPELWENTSPSGNGWLVLKLAGWKSNRDGIGARIRLFDEAGAVQANHISSAVGYASSSLGGAHFGLGGKKEAERIEIEWPSGIRQTLRHVRANQTLAVAEPR